MAGFESPTLMQENTVVTTIELVEGGNIIRQGHHLTIGYIAYDEVGEVVDLSGKDLTVSIWGRKGVAFEADAVFEDGVLRFTLDQALPSGDYNVEFTATLSTDTGYRKKYPTNTNTGRISVKQSADDLGAVGISVFTIDKFEKKQKELQDAYHLSVDSKVETLEADFEQAVGALTVDSEVVLARGEASTLRARLDAEKNAVTAQLAEKAGRAEVDSKVSQIISGTPKGTYSTLTELQTAFPSGATGVYVVAADGKWYYWGGSSWVAGGIYQATTSADFPATNIIKNGNFENGTTEWTTVNGALAAVSSELVYTISTLSASARVEQTKDVAVPGHKYYIRADVFPKYETATFMQLGAANTLNFSITPNQWNKLTAILTPTTDARFRFYHSTATNYAVGETVKFDKVFAVDLTETFGIGNEPTIAEFEKMIAGYTGSWFDGTVSPLISTKKLFAESALQNQRLTTAETKISELTGISKITPLTSDPINPPVGAMWIIIEATETLILDQSARTADTLVQAKATRVVGQKYTASSNFNLNSIELLMRKIPDVMSDVVLEVWEAVDFSNTPPTKLLSSTTIIDGNFTKINEFEWVKKKFASPVSFVTGKVYWFTMYSISGAAIGMGVAGNTIPNAEVALSSDGGLTFTVIPNDFTMKLYGV